MSLTANPSVAQVPATGGNSFHQLVNFGAERLAFKVKSSNNMEYRIKSVFGFVEPGVVTPLEIIRNVGPAKEDRLIIQFVVASTDATDPKTAFEAAATSVQSLTIPLFAA